MESTKSDPQTSTTRTNDYVIELTCEMPRDDNVGNVIEPMTETVTQRTEGNFVMALKLYEVNIAFFCLRN